MGPNDNANIATPTSNQTTVQPTDSAPIQQTSTDQNQPAPGDVSDSSAQTPPSPNAQPTQTAAQQPDASQPNIKDSAPRLAPPPPPVTDPPPAPPSGVAARIASGAKWLTQQFTGGKRTVNQIDPKTGNIQVVEQPVSGKALALSFAMELLQGGFAGEAQHGPGAIGKAGVAGAQVGNEIAAQQKAQQQQRDQLSQQQYTNQFQTLQANMHQLEYQQQAWKQNFESNKTISDMSQQQVDRIRANDPSMVGDTNVSEKDAFDVNQYPVTKWTRYATGLDYERDSDGNAIWADSRGNIVPLDTPGAHPKTVHTFTMVKSDAKDPLMVSARQAENGDQTNEGDGQPRLSAINQAAVDWGFAPKSLPKAASGTTANAAVSAKWGAQVGTANAFQNWYNNDFLPTVNKAHGVTDTDEKDLTVANVPKMYASTVTSEAKKNKIPEALVAGVLMQESSGINGQTNFAPDAKGNPTSHAAGLMQLEPATASQYGVKDQMNPDQNIAGGAAYLGDLYKRYNGDLTRTIAAYYKGPGKVPASGPVPADAMQYVTGVANKMNFVPGASSDSALKTTDLQSWMRQNPTQHFAAIQLLMRNLDASSKDKEGANLGAAFKSLPPAYQSALQQIMPPGTLGDWQSQHDQDVDIRKTQAVQAAKQANETAATEKMDKLVTPPDGFQDAINALPNGAKSLYDMSPNEWHAFMAKNGVNLPATWMSMWQVGHYLAPDKVFSNKTWYKDSKFDEQHANTFVGNFVNPYQGPENPGFDASTYAARSGFARDLAYGKRSIAMDSANRAVGHALQLEDIDNAMDQALHYSNFTPLNSMAHSLGVVVSNDPTATFDGIAAFVAPEIAKAANGGNVPDEKSVEAVRQSMKASLASHAVKSVLDGQIGLIHKQVQTINEDSQAQLGHNIKTVSPETTSAFQRLGLSTPWAEGANNQAVKDTSFKLTDIPQAKQQGYKLDPKNAQDKALWDSALKAAGNDVNKAMIALKNKGYWTGQ